MAYFAAALSTCLNRDSHLRLTLIMVITLLMIGCMSDRDDIAPSNAPKSNPSVQTKVVNKEGNYITASPNPVPVGGLTGKTTITWGTKGLPGLDVHIFVYDSSGKEVGMFATGSVGSQEAPWISQPTEFRLCHGNGPDKKMLDSVVVTLTQ
jgi:hypothetical protein